MTLLTSRPHLKIKNYWYSQFFLLSLNLAFLGSVLSNTHRVRKGARKCQWFAMKGRHRLEMVDFGTILWNPSFQTMYFYPLFPVFLRILTFLRN